MAVMEMGGKKFEIPDYEAYCEKCGTTNYIYSDMKPPYKCDECGAELDENDFTDVEFEQDDDGRYDAEV